MTFNEQELIKVNEQIKGHYYNWLKENYKEKMPGYKTKLKYLIEQFGFVKGRDKVPDGLISKMNGIEYTFCREFLVGQL